MFPLFKGFDNKRIILLKDKNLAGKLFLKIAYVITNHQEMSPIHRFKLVIIVLSLRLRLHRTIYGLDSFVLCEFESSKI